MKAGISVQVGGISILAEIGKMGKLVKRSGLVPAWRKNRFRRDVGLEQEFGPL